MALVWHGGMKWEGRPEIRPAKRGRAEWGPGIYGTTRFERASSYAKGGKVVRLVEFAPRLWLEEAAIGLETLRDFVISEAPRSKRASILAYLEGSAGRHVIGDRTLLGEGPMLHASSIVNLWVNNELAHGQRGLLLGEFLGGLGVDAACERAGSFGGEPEYWTVIFNPSVITHHRVFPPKNVSAEMMSLPSPLEARTLTLEDWLKTRQAEMVDGGPGP